MEITLHTLRAVAFAVVDPSYMIILFILGMVFYRKNKKIALMQKMIIGENINSPLELTISQIVIGILAGAGASLIIAHLGIIFNNDIIIYLMFLLSIVLNFINPKFICFSYSASLLGLVSIVFKYVSVYLNIPELYKFDVDIITLMTLVGVLHFVEGILVMIDGSKGSIPVFTNREDKIIGGFALKRFWAVPITILTLLHTNNVQSLGTNIATPDWWPLISQYKNILKDVVVTILPLYGVIGYNGVTFTKTKKKKTIFSGSLIMVYGIALIFIAQLAKLGVYFEVIVLLFAPVAHELIFRWEKNREIKGEPKYISSEDGIMVLDVALSLPAFEMGIESGDLILEVNDNKINSEKEIFKYISEVSNFLWFKVKKATGEVKIVNYNKMNSEKRIGWILVPREVPQDNVVVKVEERFKDILDKIKDKDNDK